MIRIGIVGCGRILAAHLQGYRLLREAGCDQFQITALCARREEDALGYVKRGEGPPQRPAVSDIPGDPLAVGDEYLSDFQPDVPVAVYTDYREMIAHGPIDAVNDFSVHSLHHQVAAEAFAAGKHLLSQKPLGVTIEAARRMCAQAEASGVTFGVFENLRFTPNTRHTSWAFGGDEDAEEGPVGRFQMAAMGNIGTWWAPDLVVAETPWRHQRVEAGGISLDLGPHFFDLLRCVGGELANVSAKTSVVEPTRYFLRDGQRVEPTRCDADDTFYASFETQRGASGVLFGSWAGQGCPTVVGEGPVYYGTRGRVSGDSLHLAGEDVVSLAKHYRSFASPSLQEKHFPLGLENDFALNQLDWLSAIEGGRQPETSGREGLLDLACAYAIVESNFAGRQVSLDEVLTGDLRDYQRPIDERFGLL